MRPYFILILLVAPFGLVSCNSERSVGLPVASPKISLQNQWIDNAVRDAAAPFMASMEGGGLSLGLIKNGVKYSYNFGSQSNPTNRPPTEKTLYAIASVTKTFTATLLAQAVVQGRMNLEDDIRIYLAGAYPNLQHQGQPIRLIHLLNHNSGLPLSFSDPSESKTNAFQTKLPVDRNGFYAALHQVHLQDIPGSRFRYSNAAAQLFGYILEDVYGQPFEHLVSARIARPLGMKNTKITLTRAERASLKGYGEHGFLAPSSSDDSPAAAGLKSTVTDLLQYVHWQMSENDAAVKLTHQQIWKIGDNYSLGLNWQMFNFPGYRYIWQEGSVPGFSSYCVLCPELGLGVVALVNQHDRSSADRVSTMVKRIIRQMDARAANLP